ncbi:MAG: DUF2800 domain-containing protein, partial [FCB group bacterium]|nr:DUF2800 domain-containing protein [FCB group bacterium]
CSSAGVWVHCAGWPTIAHACPDETKGEAAAEGTASHDIIPPLVRIHAIGNSPSGRQRLRDRTVGQPAANGVIVTDEMFDAAEVAADDIGDIMRKTGQFNPKIESRIDASLLIHPYSFGTVDAWIYCDHTGTLYITDYKYGHAVVDAFENWQCINYYAGITADESIRFRRNLRVVITIIQPRANHKDGIVRRWKTTGDELAPYVKRLREAARAALSPYAQCVTGSHCRWCRARSRCPALATATGHALDYVGWPIPDELNGSAIGLELDHLKGAEEIIKYRMSGLEQQAEAMAARGQYIQGYGLRDHYGNNTWIGKPADVVKHADELGVDVSKPGVMTPPQAIKAGLDKEEVEKMTHKPRRGTRLEKITDKDARRIFGRGSE